MVRSLSFLLVLAACDPSGDAASPSPDAGEDPAEPAYDAFDEPADDVDEPDPLESSSEPTKEIRAAGAKARTALERARQVNGERFRTQINDAKLCDGTVTASIGVIEAAQETIESLAERADAALRADKAARK